MFLDKIAEINGSINGVVWGVFGLALLIGTGIIVTVCTKFFQVSHIGTWWKNTIGSLFSKEVLAHRKEKAPFRRFRRCVRLWRLRSVPAISRVLPPPSASVVQARCSGCGLLLPLV